LKREKGHKNNTIKQWVKTSAIRVPGRVLELCLRRKKVEGVTVAVPN